jgi:hypothetical protein
VSDEDTKIRCHVCRSVVEKRHAFCGTCGASLTASQMRASEVKKMIPIQWREHVKEYVARLGMKPVPMSAASLKLHQDATKLLGELNSLDPDEPPPRHVFDQIIAWSLAVNHELQRKTP